MSFFEHITAGKTNKWFLTPPSNVSKARLFCLPYSGCGASIYQKWPKYIGDIEVCPIQLPGRENRFHEESFNSYESLAKELANDLLPFLDRPFAFFGHCGSALACFEISLYLESQNGPKPSNLFISSQVAPHEGPYGRFLHISDKELRNEIEFLIRKMGGNPIPDFVDLSLEVMRADIETNRRYQKDKPFNISTPITTIGWREDDEIPMELMSGWNKYGKVKFNIVEGDHHKFLEAPYDLISLIFEEMEEEI